MIQSIMCIKQTTVETKFRNMLLLWVHQQKRVTHAYTGWVGERKEKDWLGGIPIHDIGRRGEVMMTSGVRDKGPASSTTLAAPESKAMSRRK
jgi:hypothetical protein